VTGESFPQIMNQLVLRPAAMMHSTYEQPLPGKLWPLAATPAQDAVPLTRAYRFADGCRLEQGLASHRFFQGDVSQPVCTTPDHLSVVEKRDAYPRNFVE